MTHQDQDKTTAKWLSLADNLVEVAENLDTLDSQTLSRTLMELRDALSVAVTIFHTNGGLSLAERANLHQIMTAGDPALLPRNILKEGLRERWAAAMGDCKPAPFQMNELGSLPGALTSDITARPMFRVSISALNAPSRETAMNIGR